MDHHQNVRNVSAMIASIAAVFGAKYPPRHIEALEDTASSPENPTKEDTASPKTTVVKDIYARRWPYYAVLGIETQAYFNGFGNNPGEIQISYFEYDKDYEKWKAETLACIKRAKELGVRISVSVKVYMWENCVRELTYEYLE